MSVPHLCHDYVDRESTWPTQGQATSGNGMNARGYGLSVRKLSFMLSMFRAIIADLCHLGESQPAALLLVTRTFVGSCRRWKPCGLGFIKDQVTSVHGSTLLPVPPNADKNQSSCESLTMGSTVIDQRLEDPSCPGTFPSLEIQGLSPLNY